MEPKRPIELRKYLLASSGFKACNLFFTESKLTILQIYQNKNCRIELATFTCFDFFPIQDTGLKEIVCRLFDIQECLQ